MFKIPLIFSAGFFIFIYQKLIILNITSGLSGQNTLGFFHFVRLVMVKLQMILE